MRKVIAVDMDDTICELMPVCIQNHNRKFPDHIMTYDQCLSFNLEQTWHPKCNAKIFFGDEGLYRHLPLVDEYVVDEMRKIHDRHDLIIVTAAYPTVVLDKWEWLQEHMPFIPYANFIPIKRKDLLEFDLLIDDGSHNLLPAVSRNKNVIGIPRPWNQNIRDKCLFRPSPSFKGMADYVDQLLEDSTNEKCILDYHPNFF